jgi:hypothetical protein
MLDSPQLCDIIYHMGRKAKVPQEVLEFKETVEKTGLIVSFNKIPNCKTWQVNVLITSKNNKHCIWHNDPEVKNIELSKFWESKAWKEYNVNKTS